MLLTTLSQYLRAHGIQGGKILAGVSGGADSVALLRGLVAVAPEFSLQVVAGHFDHALRPESSRDAAWVGSLCDALGICCRSQRSPGITANEGTLEETARKQRYEFLLCAAREQNCRWVAVAHTADDQVETILHHILRGSGLKGVAGMPESRELASGVLLVRPLLKERRNEVVAYLDSLRQEFLTDESNTDEAFTRNRLRQVVLPVLRREVNPRVDEALLRLGTQAGDVQSAMQFLANELFDSAVLDSHADIVRLDRRQLVDRPPALLREFFSRLWERQGWPRQGLSFRHLELLAGMAVHQTPARASFPDGIEGICRDGIFELRRS